MPWHTFHQLGWTSAPPVTGAMHCCCKRTVGALHSAYVQTWLHAPSAVTASRASLLAQCAFAPTFHTTRITLSSTPSHTRRSSHTQRSREKVQLTDQLQRAEEEIERARTAIRDLIKICEDTSGQRTIPPDAIDDEGEVDAWAIVCSVCDDYESYDVSGGQGWMSKQCGMLGLKTAFSASALARLLLGQQ